ncbi:hypothetical protein [Streptomyces sp. NPDC006879]|uniref:hypothetical protein n=1 Tax=Streptomyces sp. NPDC006879 TaxID=3364767 RepID=UPI0036BABD71
MREDRARVLPLRRDSQDPGHGRPIAGDVGPGGEGAGLALLEVRQQRQVRLIALLVGAEEVP